MYCQNCGKELRSNINYCPACGKKINNNEQTKTDCKEQINSEITSNNNQGSTVLGKKQNDRKNRLSSFKVILIIVVLLITVVLSVYIINLIMSRSKDSKQPFSDSDIKNDKQQGIGQIVEFGKFEQDGNLSNGQEKLKWIVLCEENDKYLLLCSNVIYCGYYSDETTGNDWENCLVNKWLNTDFLIASFTNEEKNNITHETIHSEFLNIQEDYNNNEDIFILSHDEINCFSSLLGLQLYICEPSKYATQKSDSFVHNSDTYLTEFNGMAEFWLRTSGTAPSYDGPRGGMYIQGYGDINSGIRPAIWVNSSYFD